jgi:predicted nucleotidyltransferase
MAWHRSHKIGVTMRLNPKDLTAFRELLRATDPAGRAFLFGSRVNDARRGGDIDIYLEASQQIDLKTALALEYRMTSVCDEKVDLLIKNPGQPDQPIHVIARQGIPL